MKKILIIFILIFTLLPLQAYMYQTDSVTVNTTVSKITLSEAAASAAGDGLAGLYKLYGGLDSANAPSVESVIADDISSNDVTVYFRIAQLAKTRTDESITLSVEAERLENTDANVGLLQEPDILVYTGAPVISNVSCLSMDALQVSSAAEENNKITFFLAYSLSRPVEDVNLAFFTSTWSKTPGLAPGLYTAKITLSYITN